MKTGYNNRMANNIQTRGPGRPRKHKLWPNPLTEYPVQCPDCGSQRTKVVRKEDLSAGAIRRIRECENCGLHIPTIQAIKPMDRA